MEPATHIHTYIHTYTHTYIHTYIHTHIHTYIHTHIHQVPEVKDQKGACDLSVTHGVVEFNGVTFSYDNVTEVLSNVSFTVPAGNTLAIVGKILYTYVCPGRNGQTSRPATP